MTSSAWKMQYSKTLSCLPWTCFLKNMHPKFWRFFQACNTVKKYHEKVYIFILPVIIFNLHLWYMQTAFFWKLQFFNSVQLGMKGLIWWKQAHTA
jgi:hypothetical protein